MPCKLIKAAAICKTAEEKVIRNLDLTDLCANVWESTTGFALSSTIRPASLDAGGTVGATGLEYRTDADGFSGEDEPAFPTSIGAVVTDGSLTWHAQALSNDSLFRRVAAPSDVTWTPPDGVTCDLPTLRNTNGIQQIGIRVSGAPTSNDNVVVAHVVFTDGEELDFGFKVTTHSPS